MITEERRLGIAKQPPKSNSHQPGGGQEGGYGRRDGKVGEESGMGRLREDETDL